MITSGCPAVSVGLSFFVGSIPFGYWIGLINGIDIRQHGSGNIGSTNISRTLGKRWGVLVFILDCLKGWFPIAFLAGCGGDWGIVACAVAAVLGHNYTPWLGFKGGKGIATSAGVLFALMPLTLLISGVAWGSLMRLTKTVSIASIGACVAVPVATHIFYGSRPALLACAWAVCLFGIWRHRSNIARLRAGTELSFDKDKKDDNSSK